MEFTQAQLNKLNNRFDKRASQQNIVDIDNPTTKVADPPTKLSDDDKALLEVFKRGRDIKARRENNYPIKIDSKLPQNFESQFSIPGASSLKLDIEELQAQNQSWYNKLGRGIPRMLGSTVAQFGEGVGMMVAAPIALLTGDDKILFDNFWQDAFESLDEEVKNNFTIHQRNDIIKGDFMTQALSPEFYATEGADAAASMLSFLGIGGAGSKIGKLLKIGKRFTTVGQKLGLVDDALKFGNKVDETFIALTQSTAESFMETKQVSDDLREFWNEKLTNNGTYLLNGKEYTKEQVDDYINKALYETFLANMLVTYPSAMFTTKAVFGKGNSNLFNKLGINSNKVNEIQKRLKDINKFKSGLKSAGREFLEGVGQESFQEFSQFAIQDYASLKGKLQTMMILLMV